MDKIRFNVEFGAVLGTYTNGIARVAEKYGQNKTDMYLWGLGVLLQEYKDVEALEPVSNKEVEELSNDLMKEMIEAGGCCAEE